MCEDIVGELDEWQTVSTKDTKQYGTGSNICIGYIHNNAPYLKN